MEFTTTASLADNPTRIDALTNVMCCQIWSHIYAQRRTSTLLSARTGNEFLQRLGSDILYTRPSYLTLYPVLKQEDSISRFLVNLNEEKVLFSMPYLGILFFQVRLFP
jgi:hypothetical protein